MSEYIVLNVSKVGFNVPGHQETQSLSRYILYWRGNDSRARIIQIYEGAQEYQNMSMKSTRSGSRRPPEGSQRCRQAFKGHGPRAPRRLRLHLHCAPRRKLPPCLAAAAS